MVEVKLTAQQLKEVWSHTEWDDPFDGYANHEDTIWEFIYLTGRCAEVVKQRFLSLSCDNEDANEILNLMSKFWRDVMIDDYISQHEKEVHEAFNIWWWSNHDVTDYEEEEK